MMFSKIVGCLALTLVGVSFAQESCLLTETSCQCSTTVPSGTCLRSQGDGTCLLGLCVEGHRCDCFGYEKCSIKKCGKHVPVSGTPSETAPFKCEMVPGAGTCIDMEDYMDTVSSAQNAETDATTSNDEATITETEAVRVLEALGGEKKAVNEMMKEVERVAEEIPESELKEIEEEAMKVFDATKKCAAIVMSCIEDSRMVTAQLYDTRHDKRDGKRYEKLAKAKKEELKVEQSKKTQDKTTIDRLTVELEGLGTEGKKSCKKAGADAKAAKDKKTSTNNEYKNLVAAKEEARDASLKCMEKAQRAIGVARNKETVTKQ